MRPHWAAKNPPRTCHGNSWARTLPVGVGGAEVLRQLLDNGPQVEVGQGDDVLRIDEPATALAGTVEGRWANRLRTCPQEVHADRSAVSIGEVKYPWPADPSGHVRVGGRPHRHASDSVIEVPRTARRSPVRHGTRQTPDGLRPDLDPLRALLRREPAIADRVF